MYSTHLADDVTSCLKHVLGMLNLHCSPYHCTGLCCRITYISAWWIMKKFKTADYSCYITWKRHIFHLLLCICCFCTLYFIAYCQFCVQYVIQVCSLHLHIFGYICGLFFVKFHWRTTWLWKDDLWTTILQMQNCWPAQRMGFSCLFFSVCCGCWGLLDVIWQTVAIWCTQCLEGTRT